LVTVISRFRVRNGSEDEVRDAFVNRPRLVERAAGFRGLEVLTDAADPAIFLLVTRWTDEACYQSWHKGEAHHESHRMIPKGLKLDAAHTQITVGASIEGASVVESLNAAIETQPIALSRWLMDSDAVFAFLLLPDGTIRERNRASHRLFPSSPADGYGIKIWDYLVCADTLRLQQRLTDMENNRGARMLLNLTDAQKNPITLEVGTIPLGGAVLLLGTEENRHDAHFRSEILKLTNDLSTTMRESTRQFRELRQANETIERLARTDHLTGLANRRALAEGMMREIARADRRGGELSVIATDLDNFKTINDKHGHFLADRVLESVAATLGSQLRVYDIAARLGGDEFLLLLSGTSLSEAMAIAERARHEVARIKIPGLLEPISMSMGVAQYMTGENSEQLIARADKALYDAKNEGRNCISAAASACV
jgi:diguanylate cyclase (GGDEF)-like protein